MTPVGEPKPAQETTAEIVFRVFLRVIAAYCLIFGALYWIRLIGIYDGALWRFDLMPPHWQVASVVLAVFFPFAAIGLWGLTSWGPVIWFICALTETTMYAGFPELFGNRPAVVVSHGLVALFYMVLRLVIYREKRRQTDAS